MSTQVDDSPPNDGTANPCPICRTAECDIALSCGHQYCSRCLDEWYRRQPTASTVRCLWCQTSASAGPLVDWRNVVLQTARICVVLAIFYVDWMHFIVWNMTRAACFTLLTLLPIQLCVVMNHTNYSLFWYAIRIAVKMWTTATQQVDPYRTTNFYSIVMSIGAMSLLCILLFLLSNIRLRKAFIHDKLSPLL